MWAPVRPKVWRSRVGLGDSDLWLLMSDRCTWQDGLAAATDSQGRMVIVIDTDAALSYTFTPVAPAEYRAPLQPSSGIRYGFIPIAPEQPVSTQDAGE